MKKSIALLLALIMVFALATSAVAYADDDPFADLDPIVIEFATPNADANIESEYSQKWVNKVEEVTNGKITFNYTPGGALGTYEELLEATINGTYDMTINEPSNLIMYVPESALLNLPMLYSSYDECTWVFDGEVGDWWADLVRENAGLEVLNYYYCGFRYVISKDEIKTLDDCNGMIIRSPGASNYLDTLTMLGFKCETMAFSEAYTAMETGVIEAVECPLQNLYSQGYYNLCNYLLGTRHIFSENCIFANAEFWAGLPEAYQEVLKSTLDEITAEERTECDAREQQFLKDFAEKGVTFNEFDEASMAKVVEMFTEYWTANLTENAPDALDMLNVIVAHKG